MTNHNDNQATAIVEALHILMRYRWRFMLPAFLISTGIICLSLLLPRQYEAKAVFERRTDMVLTEMMTRGAPNGFTDPRQSLAKEITGPVALDEMVRAIEAEALQEHGRTVPAEQLYALRQAVERETVVQYQIATEPRDRIEVAYVGRDPLLAQLAVNALVENYIHHTRQEITGRLRQSEAFFRQEMGHARELIEQIENEKLIFEIENAELLPDSPNSLQATLTEVQAALAASQLQHDAAAMQVAALERQLTATPAEIPSVVTGPNPERAEVARQLQAARNKLHEYRHVYKMTSKHPDVQDVQQQVAQLEAALPTLDEQVVLERHTSKNPQRDKLATQLAQAQTEISTLEKQVRTHRQQLEAHQERAGHLFPTRAAYRKLERKMAQAQRQLTFWEDNLRRVGLLLSAESGDRGIQLDFIKPCPALEQPVSPDSRHVLLAAVMLGLLSGGLSVLFAHRTDESFAHGDRAAKSVDLPLLGSVSELITQRQRRMRQLRNVIVYPLNAMLMALVLLLAAGVMHLSLSEPALYQELADDPVAFVRQHVLNPGDKTVSDKVPSDKASPE